MKKLTTFFVVSVFAALSASLVPSAFGQEAEPTFTVARLVVCESIENREPVGIADTFPAATPKVYGFLEAVDISEDTPISIVWYLGENETAKVDLSLRKGPRWRTYSSKNLGGLKGDWKVELRDANGSVVKTAAFKVE